MEETTLDRLIRLTQQFAEGRPGNFPLGPESAISQDAYIFGVDVEDYVEVLEKEFGPVVWSIPWLHFTDQRGSYRGCAACLAMPILIPWMLLKKLLWGEAALNPPNPREYPHRLTLKEVAAAIDAGGWPQDWRPE